jgi:hypothetical protein
LAGRKADFRPIRSRNRQKLFPIGNPGPRSATEPRGGALRWGREREERGPDMRITTVIINAGFAFGLMLASTVLLLV